MHLNLLVVLITKLTTYSDQWSYNVIPLLYGGVEMHTKHDWDPKFGKQKRINIISKRKADNTPKLKQTKYKGWDELG